MHILENYTHYYPTTSHIIEMGVAMCHHTYHAGTHIIINNTTASHCSVVHTAACDQV